MRPLFLLAALSLLLAACQKAETNSSSSKNYATGPMSVPNITCSNGSKCLSSSSIMSFGEEAEIQTTDSKGLLLQYATVIYTNFTDTIIPGINEILYTLETAAKNNGLNTCADVAGATNQTGFSLGGGYTVDISAGSKSIPSPMTDNGTTMSKKYKFYNNGTAFATAEIYCNSSTKRTFYVRIHDSSSSKSYEFWSQSDSSSTAKILFGAFDSGSQKYTVYFNGTSDTVFQLHTVGNSIQTDSGASSWAIAGGVNLGTGIADIGIALVSATTAPTSLTAAAANVSGWASSASDIRHCYDSITNVTVTTTAATCTGLLSAAPGTIPVRSSPTAWTINGMNSAVSTTF